MKKSAEFYFLASGIFSWCNYDPLFSTAPSKHYQQRNFDVYVDSKGKRFFLSRGAIRFYASIRVFLQMGGAIPLRIIDCVNPPRLTLNQ